MSFQLEVFSENAGIFILKTEHSTHSTLNTQH